MPPELAIKAKIAQIKASGRVAEANTWIGYSTITKNGKKYTYYRLMKAVPKPGDSDPDNPQKSKVKGKMAQYLGSETSKAYKEMREAIARRNEIQRLERKLHSLEKGVCEGQGKPRKQRNTKPSLTALVKELIAQVETLQTEFEAKIESLEREFKQRLSMVNL
ncbi:transposase [Crocosphaera sp. Alani8]|uniref:transposase n=1 Tax=Crocosphaera sp. Alani8 TaxID=3038952 RepID=UPI00313DE040